MADLTVEQIQGQPVLQVRVKQEAIARYGVAASTVLDLVESVGSKPLGEVVEGQIRFPLRRVLAGEASAIVGGDRQAMLVPTATGERIPLSRLADVEVTEGPATITCRGYGPAANPDHVQRPRPGPGQLRRAEGAAEGGGRVAAMPPGRYHLSWEGQ